MTFNERVYSIVAEIPAGRVATYGQVAALAGQAGAARAVGNALRQNHDSKRVPCHRVVGADGSMHGYAYGGVVTKREKLANEGVVLRGDRADLSLSRWVPEGH